MSRSRRVFAALLLLVFATPSHATLLPDSTDVEAWRLENGLEVRTRHIPGAAGVSVSLAFRAGSGYEPAGQEGLSALLAELQFMGAAGDVPERTRAEMASLRPLGWESRPGTRLVQFTEIATPAQLPGVLHQFATRLAGVRVDDAALRAALAQVRRDAGERLFGEPADVLYWRAGALARGLSDELIVRRSGLPGLARLTPKDATTQLRRWYHAGNASLALAGDLSGLDVHALVAALFGKLPGGPAIPDTVQVRFHPGKRTVRWKGIQVPLGVIADASPALTDSLHPAYYLGLLVTAAGVSSAWGAPLPPLSSRFQYSLLDEPEIVRFYPPVRAADSEPGLVAEALHEQLEIIRGQLVTADILVRVRKSVRWLLGADLPDGVLARVRREPGGLGTVSSGMATRALWMGDGFWNDYLARLDRLMMGPDYFYDWMADPQHQSILVLTPSR